MRAKFLVPSLAILGAALGTQVNAQSVVTRSITTEPVETVVTRSPAGAVVTRRPVANTPVAGAAIVAPVAPPPYAASSATIAYDGDDSIDGVATRAAVQRGGMTSTRQLVTREVAARPQTRRVTTKERKRVKQTRTTARATVTRAAPQRPAPRVLLNPAERQIVYRTIVEQSVQPRVVPQHQVVVAPVVQQPYVRAVQAPVLAQQDLVLPQPAPVYTVGAVLPQNTPIYAMPHNVSLRVPAAQPYGYAYVGGRAYLVDAPSNTIVADVTD